MATFGPIQGLGTVWYFEFFDGVFDTKAAARTTELMRDFDLNYSRFKKHSWLSRLNDEREFKNPDPEFIDLLELSLRYFDETGGIFNIAIGEKMEASGYDADYSLRGQSETLPEVPPLREVLSVSGETVTLRTGRLDLGGIGKGYLIDKLANFFKQELGLSQFLINGGGDIYVTEDNGKPIEIQLAHPLDKNKYIATVSLRHQGFAGSSPFLRAWKDPHTGKEYNHLHTDNKVSSFIIADTTTLADVYGTVLAIAPESKHPEGLKKMLLQETKVIYQDEEFNLV